VWTSKRILLLVGGASLFFAGYLLYAAFLGGIDGLPPLPAAYLPGTPPVLFEPPTSLRDQKLALAFGEDCQELRRQFRIEVSQHDFVLAFENYYIEKGGKRDGWVKLEPFSIALFKEKKDGSYPEVTTIRSPEAYLRFDQPIRELTDLSKHRIVGAELREEVTIVNNRHTPLKSDDIEVRITMAPVLFDEQQGRVWTEGFVKLLDGQSQPEPTEVKAKGLDIYLTRQPADKAPAARSPEGKRKNAPFNGVERLVLHSDVEMHLLVDSNSGFLGSSPGKKEGAAAPPNSVGKDTRPAAKSRVIIKTPGSFTYYVAPDKAIFESPPAQAGRSGGLAAPPHVAVSREHLHNGKMYDHLICGKLELQFRRKSGAVADPDHPGGDREIAAARATAAPAEEVNLAMDTENLDAHGEEFLYYAATPDKGPEMILRGGAKRPFWAVKDAHLLTARELHLYGPDRNGQGQRGIAAGPGRIDLLDPKGGNNTVHQYHALWQDQLVVCKDREGDREYDLLTFVGEAIFLDDEHHQEMRGDKLQVWLEPPPREEPPPGPQNKKQPASTAPRQRPHKIEAFDHVQVRSPELQVYHTEHLLVRFQDGPASQLPASLTRLSATAPAAPASNPSATAAAAPPPGAATPSPGKAGPPTSPAPAAPASNATTPPAVPRTTEKKEDAPHRPLQLWARRVTAYVLRAGNRQELQEVVTEGAVHVHQDGAHPEDKGIDIRGEVLNLTRSPEGDVLLVFGDARGPAQLQLGDLLLAGPKVTINQKLNVAEVQGQGAMRLPTSTALEGGPTPKPGAFLTIYWSQDMYFDGTVADFRGGIEAQQEGGQLLCQALQVTLDRRVSFKEGQKGGQSAKIKDLLCDRKVYLVNLTKDAQGQFLRYDRLQGTALLTNNQEGRTTVEGPGIITSYQKGVPEGLAPPAKGNTPRPNSDFYLTRVEFKGRVFSLVRTDPADEHQKMRTTTFYDQVQVYHGPADGPDARIDLDHLPRGGFVLRCGQLVVTSRTLPSGKTVQSMTASKNVAFSAAECNGQAPTVKYEQATETVFFLGAPGAPVVLNRFRGPGQPPEQMTGQEIRYNRRTGEFQVTRGGQIISATH
jgi:lipopolysaccharide export system protein LptA